MMNRHECRTGRRPQSVKRTIVRYVLFIPLVLVFTTGVALSAYLHHMRNLPPVRSECVILVHGLYRSAASMSLIEHRLINEGYKVINIDYASTRTSIHAVAEKEVAAAVARAKKQGYERIHFVSNSLGALIIRTYLQEHHLPKGSRIIMLAPPNQGSELADWAHETFPRLSRLAGPAATRLGTRNQPFTSKLNPIGGEIGIIIGDQSWNPLFSEILPGSDDGAVTIERAKLTEMREFLVTSCNHTTILLVPHIRDQVLCFLQTGRFSDASPAKQHAENGSSH